MSYSLRFLLAGDLAGCWAPFGGISTQFAHIGLIFNVAVVENGAIAMTYAKQFRGKPRILRGNGPQPSTGSLPCRMRVALRKKNALREIGHASLTNQPTEKQHAPKRDPPSRTYDKGGDKGGKDPKGKKKGGQPRRDWGKTNNWGRADWGADRASQAQPQPQQLANVGTHLVTAAADQPAVAPKKGGGK